MTRDEAPASGRRGTRVAGVVAALRERIEAGEVRPGERLPPESKLAETFSVSRTVIREAIAGLRADGLVEPRQGAGVFVLEPVKAPPRPFEIDDVERLSSILEMLEVRVAVEMEAAALAAVRRSPAQEEAILDAAAAILRLAAEGAATVEADIRFHATIAEATNNPRFRECLDLMGGAMIPRATLRGADAAVGAEGYIARIAAEHDAIADAIGRADPEAAREAMRRHLRGSQQRYRELIRKSAMSSDR
ncbi:MAG: FadR/GntR family transcriptional regulator [Paracoccaceae bacterium]